MSTALTQVHTGTDLDITETAQHLTRSGYFKDARDVSQAVVKVLYGREIGVGPVTAMMSIHVIEGKPAPSANLIAARVKASGRYDYRVREHSADVCRIEFFERAGAERESLGVIEWSMEDARRAGLGGRGPWKNYPRAMLFARAISEGARVHCPEVFGGAAVYTPEELGAEVNADGDPVNLPPVEMHTVRQVSGSHGYEQPDPEGDARDEEHTALLAALNMARRQLPKDNEVRTLVGSRWSEAREDINVARSLEQAVMAELDALEPAGAA